MILAAATLAALGWAAPMKAPEQAKAAADLERELTGYIRLLADWGGLTRYGSANADLGRPAPGVGRVVFLGDEITEHWSRNGGEFFRGRPYLNRGIAHQTTGQMLVRFRQDVVDLEPRAVVIQGGSSDLAGYAGPATERTIADNVMSMVELAQAHGIAVILASVTPVCDCFGNVTERRPPGKIRGLNRWLEGYAARTGAIYLDYYTTLARAGAMNQDLTADGIVPNRAGYTTMAPLAEQAIRQALGRRSGTEIRRKP